MVYRSKQLMLRSRGPFGFKPGDAVPGAGGNSSRRANVEFFSGWKLVYLSFNRESGFDVVVAGVLDTWF